MPRSWSAAGWLDRAAARVLPDSIGGRVLRYESTIDRPLWEQSDRMYGPYIPFMLASTRWLDLATRVEGSQPVGRAVAPGRPPAQLDFPAGTARARDTSFTIIPTEFANGSTIRLNPWAVLLEWRAHVADVRIAGRCTYREYPRVVLTRESERLYLGESDAIPVKLDRIEPHYLWGQVTATYLWTTWWGVSEEGRGGGRGGLYPLASVRQFDGTIYERVGLSSGSAIMLPADSAPRLVLPANLSADPRFTAALSNTVDTVRVSAQTFLLRTPMYTETVTLRRDTVFVLDATTSETRARADSTWIAKLFPGRHPVVLVVTDLAWPHISGVRFWVARGATIVSHRESRDFLLRAINRHWSLAPDALERSRAVANFRFRAVDDSLRLAGGDLVVHAFRGSPTELAVGVWSPSDRFFWAGDYIQPDPTSPYARAVVETLRALRLAPEKIAAQHVGLTPWKDIERTVPGVTTR